MLFSILIGAAATVFFLAKAVLLKLKVFLGRLKDKNASVVDKSYMPYVIYSEDKRYWTVFKDVAAEFEKRQTELVYLTGSKDDPVFLQNYKFVKAEFIGEGNSAFARLNMLSAGILLTTTPSLDVFQWKRSRNVKHYAYILHGTGDATMMRVFALDYYDSILLTGDYQAEDIRILENKRKLPKKELLTVGCTYLDNLARTATAAQGSGDNRAFTVLVSPSWGADALLTRFGERLLDPLRDTGWNIIIRPHPQTRISEKDVLERLQKKYKDAPNIQWDFESDNLKSMLNADIMISDFSSIIFDYTFVFNKPVIYVNADMNLEPYDAYDLHKEIWQFKALKKFAIELKEEHFADIKKLIEETRDNEHLAAERTKAKETAWMHRMEAGKRTADFMLKTVSKDQATA